MATNLMNISQIRHQLQGLGETITDFEMTICAQNAFPPH